MFKTASVNGESRNGHAPIPVPAPAKRPARPCKRPNPPCPFCNDQFVVFHRIDKPDNLHCVSCNRYFNVAVVRKWVGEWIAFLDAQGGHAEEA